METKSPREPNVSLSCGYAGSPGAAWGASVNFWQSGNVIRARTEDEYYRASKRFPAKPSPWRAIARFLANEGDGWGVPWESSVWCEAPSFEPYQRNVIEICWLRMEDEYDSSWGESILLLPDPWLAEAYALYGSLKPDIEARCDIGDGVSPDDDRIDNEDGNERLAWTYNLQLLAFAIELQDLSVSDLAEKMGTGASTTPYADTMRILRRRNKEFELLREEVGATTYKNFGSSAAGHAIGQSIFYHSAHRKFLLNGTIDNTQ